MSNTIKSMLEHPIASIFVVGAVGSAISRIIYAVRGIPGYLSVTTKTAEQKTEDE